jgi:hypothetical protein
VVHLSFNHPEEPENKMDKWKKRHPGEPFFIKVFREDTDKEITISINSEILGYRGMVFVILFLVINI